MGVALIQHHMGTVGIPLVMYGRVYESPAELCSASDLVVQVSTSAQIRPEETGHSEGRRAGDHSTGTTEYCRLGLVNESSEDRDIN